jgi:hypothetical protein
MALCAFPRLYGAMSRGGAWLVPRITMALLLVMCCEMVWILALREPTGRFIVSAANTGQTLVRFFYKTPPPWPRGNCFEVSSKPRWVGPVGGFQTTSWRVCNMHAENFSAVVPRLKPQEVQIQRVDGGRCLIIDPRIPREYLLNEPSPACTQVPESQAFLRQYPEHFSKPLGR